MNSENRDNLCFIPITMYENICFVRVKETVSQNLRLIEKRMIIVLRVNICLCLPHHNSNYCLFKIKMLVTRIFFNI